MPVPQQSAFDRWVHSFGGAGPPPAEQDRLALKLCNVISMRRQRIEPNVSGSVPTARDAVTWKGVSVFWFRHVFMATEEAGKLVAHGARMWFVRDRCIPLMIRNRGVRFGTVLDYHDKFNSRRNEFLLGGSEDRVVRLVNDATCFVSYTGDITLADFNALLGAHPAFAGKYLWIDFLCICMPTWTERRDDDDVAAFRTGPFMTNLRDRVRAIDHTALLLPDWEGLGDALGRCWVLWELLASYSSSSSSTTSDDGNSDDAGAAPGLVEVVLPKAERRHFLEDTLGSRDGFDDVVNTLAAVDISSARSRQADDTQAVLSLVEQGDGVVRANEKVARLLRAWMLKAGREHYDASGLGSSNSSIGGQYANRDVLIGLCSNMAALSLDFGEYADAEMYARTAVRLYDDGGGGGGSDNDRDNHEQDDSNAVEMISSRRLLGRAALAQGELADAEKELTAALEQARAQLGTAHEETIAVLTALAEVCDQRGEHARADDLLAQAIAARKGLYGDDGEDLDDDRLFLEQRRADVLAHMGRLVEAEALHRTTLAAIRECFGERSVHTVRARTRLADVLVAVAAAETKTARAKARPRATTTTAAGPAGDGDAAATAAARAAAAAKLAEAEAELRDALGVSTAVAGRGHAQTLDTQRSLAQALVASAAALALGGDKAGETERLDEAETLLRGVAAEITRQLGAEHAGAVHASEDVAALLVSKGALVTATEMYGGVVEGFETALGAEHADTLAAMARHGALLLRVQRLADAAVVLQKALRVYRGRLGGKHKDTLGVMVDAGVVASRQRKVDDAVALLNEAEAGVAETLGKQSSLWIRVHEEAAEAKAALAQRERAKKKKKKKKKGGFSLCGCFQ